MPPPGESPLKWLLLHHIIQLKLDMSCKTSPETLLRKDEGVQKGGSCLRGGEGAKDPVSTIIQPEKQDNFDFEGYNEKDSQARNEQLQEADLRHEEWSFSDENRLIELHNKKGNRWVQIARDLNRNDNAVKNHYHSKFRKTLRKINKCITDHLKGQLRPLKNSIISKIVQTAEGRYVTSEEQTHPQAETAFDLKNRILQHASLQQQQTSTQEIISIKTLVSQIQKFTREVKDSKKGKAPDVSTSNKYKGKEIKSLLTENSRNNAHSFPLEGREDRQPTRQAARQTRGGGLHQLKPSVPEQLVQPTPGLPEQLTKPSMSDQLSNPTLSQQYQPFFLINKGFLSQPVFYPMYAQQGSFLFSGRQSSFTSYSPIPASEGQIDTMTSWTSLNSMSQMQPSSARLQPQGFPSENGLPTTSLS